MMSPKERTLQRTRRRFAYSTSFLLLALVLLWLAGYALAAVNELPAADTVATFTVNSSGDSAVCDETTCTLRGAILAANSQPGADIINFSLPAGATITLTADLPLINDLLTIDGRAAAGLSLSGAATHRIFEIGSSTAVALHQLRLTQGGGHLLGGAILVNEDGQLTISSCTLETNAATNRGGAIHNDGGNIDVIESVFNENSASKRGGAIYNDGGQMSISASTFSANITGAGGDGGGAIYNSGDLTLTASVLDGNAVGSPTGGGGALFNDTSGLLTVADSTFSANTALDGGGAIRNTGSLTVTGSTLVANMASDANSAGGGLLNSSSGVALLANSTIHNNSAYMGGGIRNSAFLTLTNVTVSGNSANPGFGGGLFNTNSGTLNYTNSILADSPTGGDCRNEGAIAIRVQNLVESGVCGQDIMLDPALGPLQDNGGPTATQALLTGSPAVNVGDNSACAAVPVNNIDQRGLARPQAGTCDLGAFEVQPIAGLTADSDSPTELGSPTAFTATISTGDGVTFTWDFGDGTTGVGALINHTYLEPGEFTAVVVATNALSQQEASTKVTVAQTIYAYYMPAIIKSQ